MMNIKPEGDPPPIDNGATATVVAPVLDFDHHQKLIAAASVGDIEAQRSLRNLALESYSVGVSDIATAGLWASIMARLAAAHGDRFDKLALASTLCFHAGYFGQIASIAEENGDSVVTAYNRERHDDLVGEAYAILDALADGDDDVAEHAACYLQGNALFVRPEVLNAAKEMRGMV